MKRINMVRDNVTFSFSIKVDQVFGRDDVHGPNCLYRHFFM